MKRKIMIGVLAAVAFTANPARASVYSYLMNNNSVLSIDTSAGTGSLKGSDINATFTGDFTSFAGGFDLPDFMANITIDPNSTRIYRGGTYSLAPGHQPMLKTGSFAYTNAPANAVNLWATWSNPGCANCSPLGDYGVTAVSSSTSSGGAAVPEPGMIGLFGLGLVGLVLGRRHGARRLPALA